MIGCTNLVVDVTQIGVVILLMVLSWSGPSHVSRLNVLQVGGTLHWPKMLNLLLKVIIVVLNSSGSLAVSLN